MESKHIARLRSRQQILRAIRSHFDAAGYLEVETPQLVSSPGLDLHLDAFSVETGRTTARYLHTSPEYAMKRLVAAGLPRIYQLCKVFRRDECGALHSPEFSMLEWYRRDLDLDGLIAETETMVAAVCLSTRGSLRLNRAQGLVIDLTPPWPRLAVRDAFLRYAGVTMDDVLPNEERFFRLLVDRIEPALNPARPTVLYGYPASMASLARLSPDDPSIADRFEAYVGGVELCNGFAELTDPVEQRRRLETERDQRRALGKAAYPLDERFLGALEAGLPACAGNALGVDRLAMLLTDAATIAEVMTFTSDQV